VSNHEPFLFSAYAKFAAQAQGHVRIVVESKSDVQFLQRSAIANFQHGMVSSVTIYSAGSSCASSKGVGKLTSMLKNAGIGTIVCKDDIVELYRDSSGSSGESSDSEKSEEEKHSNDKDPSEAYFPPNDEKEVITKKAGKLGRFARALFFLLVLSVAAASLYCLLGGDGPLIKGRIFQVLKDFCKNLFQVVKTVLCAAWNTASGFFANGGTSSRVGARDEKTKSENSPLINSNSEHAHHDFFVESAGSTGPSHEAVIQ